MKKIILMTVFLCSLLFTGAAGAKAQNGIPPGSYQASCFEVKVAGNVLEASCNQPGGDKSFRLANKFEDFFLCADDIRNDKGKIKCTKSDDAPLMKKAAAAIRQAFEKIYGMKYDGGIMETRFWLREMFKSQPDFVNTFYKGLTLGQAGLFISKFVQRADKADIRLAIINKGFYDVYGFAPQPKDVAFWNAQSNKLGYFYESIVLGETDKLNKTGSDGKNPSRRLMINSAYKKAMGRNATGEEISYWEKRPEIHRQILNSARDWLYSSNGATDLADTVKRKLTEKNGNAPGKEQISQAIIEYSKKKLIYDEM